MLILRKASDRGHADHGWLKSQHTFSFADYHDPRHMGFGNLRVINEDRIAGGTGFGVHGHRDMEIVSYVISGALAHRDDRGSGTLDAQQVLRPGDVQRMTAGRGVRHSEFNALPDAETHFLQIWIEPGRVGLDPGYEQKTYPDAAKRGRLCLVASPDGRDGSLTLNADAAIGAGLFDIGEQVLHAIDPTRRVYAQVVKGQVRVNGQLLMAGDGLGLENETQLHIEDGVESELLVFDLR